MIWRATPAPLADAHDDHLRPARGWVVLAIGGARGITAEIVQALAAPGVRLVLVGRGDEKRPDASAERERVTRAMIDAGADVTFEPCDVRDEAAFGSLIDNLYDRFGRLDAIVHGAGVIDDQRFDRKSRASFDRVFETKVNSTLALARHVRAGTLKWAAFFGSISGRFGNLGQADYAAANETMARLACAVDALWAPARVVTIHWGPWRGGGMASAAVQDVLSMQGIGLIQPAAGTKFFLDEVLSGSREREVIAGTGFWTATSDPPA
jgi:NAD(P)-dependent dehydrogenase (short-subunit alcohol dehydrogenase family)